MKIKFKTINTRTRSKFHLKHEDDRLEAYMKEIFNENGNEVCFERYWTLNEIVSRDFFHNCKKNENGQHDLELTHDGKTVVLKLDNKRGKFSRSYKKGDIIVEYTSDGTNINVKHKNKKWHHFTQTKYDFNHLAKCKIINPIFGKTKLKIGNDEFEF